MFNKVIMAGNLTRDPKLSYTPSNTVVVDFGLAVNRRWTSKDGETKEEVCFVDCRAFGKTGENINKYFKKGNPILVEGRLTFDQWTSKDGTKHSKHRIIVENFSFIGTKEKTEEADVQEADVQPEKSETLKQLEQDIPF